MKNVKYFLLLISQLVIVELVIWFHTSGSGWHVEELLPGDAITLWVILMKPIIMQPWD